MLHVITRLTMAGMQTMSPAGRAGALTLSIDKNLYLMTQ